MAEITQNEAIKEIRAEAKKNGFTFKVSNAKLNGKRLYQLVNRTTGRMVIDNYRLWSAYADCRSGYLYTLHMTPD